MQNLKKLREERGISQQKLSKDIGVSRSTIAMWETGKSQPDNDCLKMLASYFEVSVDYLLGIAIEPEEITHARLLVRDLYRKQNISVQTIEESLGVNYPTFKCWLNGSGDYFSSATGLFKIAAMLNVSIEYLIGRAFAPFHSSKIVVPVLGYVAAGVPIEAIEDIIDYEELNPNDFNPNFEYFGLKIKGDSMSPKIQDGDVVIVRKQPNIENGEIAIVCINGDNATCKQIKKHENGISLLPYNREYDIKFFTNKEVDELPVVILGKVIELRRKF